MKKKVIIGLIAIVVLISCIIIININKNNKFEYSVEQIKEKNYFLYMKDNKYGVIDRNGEVIIDPIHDIIEIPNPSKDLFICKNNYNAEKDEYNVQVFDKNKNPILYQYYDIGAIELNGVQNNGFYEKSVLKYKSNGLYGLVNISGEKITDAEYESIEGFQYNEGLFLVKKSGKFGIINMNGATVIKEKYDEILSDGYYQDNYKKSGYIVGTRTNNGMRYGYIDNNRKVLLKNEYNDIYRINDKSDNEVYIVAYKNGKAGMYKNKKIIINHDYEDIIYNGENDLLVLQKGSKQGISKFDGSIIIPIEYDNILFAGNYINAQKGEKIEIFDTNGKNESDSGYISRQNVADNKYQIVSTSNGQYKIIVTGTGEIVENEYSYIQYLFDDYFIVQKGGYSGIIDKKGNKIIDFKYIAIQNVYEFPVVELVNDKGNITLLNKELKEIITTKTENVKIYENYIKVVKDKKINYIDKNGKLLDEPVYSLLDMPDMIKNYEKVDLGYGEPYYKDK